MTFQWSSIDWNQVAFWRVCHCQDLLKTQDKPLRLLTHFTLKMCALTERYLFFSETLRMVPNQAVVTVYPFNLGIACIWTTLTAVTELFNSTMTIAVYWTGCTDGALLDGLFWLGSPSRRKARRMSKVGAALVRTREDKAFIWLAYAALIFVAFAQVLLATRVSFTLVYFEQSR